MQVTHRFYLPFINKISVCHAYAIWLDLADNSTLMQWRGRYWTRSLKGTFVSERTHETVNRLSQVWQYSLTDTFSFSCSHIFMFLLTLLLTDETLRSPRRDTHAWKTAMQSWSRTLMRAKTIAQPTETNGMMIIMIMATKTLSMTQMIVPTKVMSAIKLTKNPTGEISHLFMRSS